MEHNEPRQERSPAPRDHTQRRRTDAQRRPDRQRPDRSRQKRPAESNPAREAGTARAKRPDRQRPRSADRRAPRPEGQTVEHRRSTYPVQRQARRPAKKPAYGRLFDHRFRVRLITTLALAAAMILCFIVFFRVNTISVTGNEKYTQQEVLDASGIEKGDALLLVNKSAAAGKIIAALPYIDQIRIGVAFPNVVRIEVKELDTAYAVAASDGTYWLINSSGRVVEETTGKAAAGYLQLTGFQVDPPKAGATISASSAAAKTDPQTGDTASGSENGDATSGDQTGDTTSDGEATAANTEKTDDATPEERLQTALEILQALESSGAAGVTQINVASLNDIKVFYGTQYEVDFGAAVDLSYKVEYMLAAVAQLDDYESGVLDLTFQEEKTARFIPFES